MLLREASSFLRLARRPRIFNVPTLVDEAIRFVDALLDGGALGPASALLLGHQPAPATRPMTPWDRFRILKRVVPCSR